MRRPLVDGVLHISLEDASHSPALPSLCPGGSMLLIVSETELLLCLLLREDLTAARLRALRASCLESTFTVPSVQGGGESPLPACDT